MIANAQHPSFADRERFQMDRSLLIQPAAVLARIIHEVEQNLFYNRYIDMHECRLRLRSRVNHHGQARLVRSLPQQPTARTSRPPPATAAPASRKGGCIAAGKQSVAMGGPPVNAHRRWGVTR